MQRYFAGRYLFLGTSARSEQALIGAPHVFWHAYPCCTGHLYNALQGCEESLTLDAVNSFQRALQYQELEKPQFGAAMPPGFFIKVCSLLGWS